MSRIDFSRRALLQRLGLGAGFLPLLGATRPLAAAPAFPRRLVTIAWTNGVLAKHYWPTGSGDTFTIDPAGVMRSLIPHQKDIIVLDNLFNGPGHDTGGIAPGHDFPPYMLTGAMHKVIAPSGSVSQHTANSISVDQYVADKIAASEKLPFHSLAIAPHTNGWFVHARHISFRGPAIGDQPNVPTRWTDPYQLFQALFAAGKTGPGVDPAKVAELLARRKSVFDFVGKQLESFSQILGSDDRQKVQAHIEGVRAVERQLATPASGVGACMAPAVPAGMDLKTKDHNNDWNKLLRAFSDLVLAAFRCDLTRVAAPFWGDSANNGVTFFWLGQEFSAAIKYDSAGGSSKMLQHHSLGHHGDRDATYVAMKNAVDSWFISEFAYILAEMKKVPEGSGTMLDNSALLFGNLMSHGGSHSTRRLPWIVAGRAAGQFRTGRYLKQPADVPHNGVLVALANAMLDGTQDPLKHFGGEKYGGELPGLRGA